MNRKKIFKKLTFLFLCVLGPLLPLYSARADQFNAPEVLKARDPLILLYERSNYVRSAQMKDYDATQGKVFTTFQPGLEIFSDIKGIDVYLFDQKIGTTPLELNDLAPNFYHIRLEIAHYKTMDFWAKVEAGKRTSIYANPKKKKGSAIISGIPGKIQTFKIDNKDVDQTKIKKGVLTLSMAEGRHTLTMTAFPFKPYVATFLIRSEGTTSVPVKLIKETVQRFMLIKVQPKNQYLPAGKPLVVSYSIAHPDAGYIQIRSIDPITHVVTPLLRKVISLRQKYNKIVWMPMTKQGQPITKGSFEVRLSLVGIKKGKKPVFTKKFQISKKFVPTFPVNQSGYAGLSFMPAAEVMGAGQSKFTIDGTITGYTAGPALSTGDTVGFGVFANFIASPVPDFSLGFHTGFDRTSLNSFIPLDLFLKYAYINVGDLKAAFIIRGGYSIPMSTGDYTNGWDAEITFPFQWRVSPVGGVGLSIGALHTYEGGYQTPIQFGSYYRSGMFVVGGSLFFNPIAFTQTSWDNLIAIGFDWNIQKPYTGFNFKLSAKYYPIFSLTEPYRDRLTFDLQIGS